MGTSFAGVFTKSATAAACSGLAGGPGLRTGQSHTTNAGNANAFTGRAGDKQYQITGLYLQDAQLREDRISSPQPGLLASPWTDRLWQNMRAR